MLTTLAVDGYRSLRTLVVPLAPLTVVTGANGSGKSNLYRALRLLAAAGREGVVAALAGEGGLPSTLWAGPASGASRGGGPVQGTVRSGPIAVRLAFGADDFGYAMDLGIPIPSETAFGRDPEIKVEAVWSGPFLRPSTLLSERRGGSVRMRDGGDWRVFERTLPSWASMLTEVGDPTGAPELVGLRDSLRSWRFYDHVRTDQDAPARRTSVGTRTPVLASDGADLAAALQTIREQGQEARLAGAIDRAFPGSTVAVEEQAGRLALLLRQPGLLRPLEAAELSDGTLRYLIWIAALLSERPADFLVLNEPETSLHPSLLPPLADLIVDAASRSQIVVVSHAPQLVAALGAGGALVHELQKRSGETSLRGQAVLDAPAWYWPKR
ncbi:AAA family ATPase [soil metagenome]